MTARRWQARYRLAHGFAGGSARLRAAGYRLVNGEQGGVWLSRPGLGTVWYPTWQAAYKAAASGRTPLARVVK